MKIARDKITKRITETQFGEDIEILFKNAKVSHPGQDIEVIDMTMQEYQQQITIQKTPEIIREEKIKVEEGIILRQMAIDSLIAKGEI